MSESTEPRAAARVTEQDIDDARVTFEHAVLAYATGQTDVGAYGRAIWDLKSFIRNAIAPTGPGRVVIDRERLRDIIANRIEIEYDDGDLATDVVTYRIMQDIVAAERAASGGT